MTAEPEYQINLRLPIPRWLMWTGVALLGFASGSLTWQGVVAADEDTAYEQGRRDGFNEGQDAHCEESRVMRAAGWLLAPKDER